jgi:voltage-gated potassium channel Kch
MGLDALAVPLEQPSPAMAEAWEGRLGPSGSSEDPALLQDLGLAASHAALFCSREDGLNLSLALRVRDAHPDLPLVISFYDPSLGRKIQQELGHCSVLSPAEISASRFAASALHGGVLQTVAHGGRTLAILKDPKDGSFAEAPIVLPGTRLVPLERLCNPAAEDSPQAPGLGQPFLRLPGRMDPFLAGILGLIAVILAAATVYFRFSQKISWLSSAYFVVTTFCTVGYGDFSLRDATDSAKVAGILLMLASVTLTALLFAILTNALVAKRTDALEGRRRYRLKGHVLVCGLGSLGKGVAECLRDFGLSVLVIERERDSPLLEELTARRIPFMVADATRVTALKAAGADRARALVSTLDDDLTGLEIGLAARALRPGLHLVLRIFDGTFAERLERHFRIHTALSTSTIAAAAFLARAIHPSAVALLEARATWQVLAERHRDDQPWAGERILLAGDRHLLVVPREGVPGASS